MSELIVSVSGLRGVVGQSLTPIVAAEYAAAFIAEAAEPGPIVITRDGRSSGESFFMAAASAVLASGRDVLDGGIAATPTTGVLVRQFRAGGGIQISASHNPPNYNGIKLLNANGRVVNNDIGAAIRRAFQDRRNHFVGHDQLGRTSPIRDTTSQHLMSVLATVNAPLIRNRRFRVLLDSNHGAGSVLGRRLLEELGCEIELVGGHPDGKFAHPPEPTESNLTQVADQVARGNFDIGFCQDPDADRLAIIDQHGRYIGEEYTLALALENRLSQQPGTVVINCSTSRMAIDIAARHGSQCLTSGVGEANVVDMMIATGAVYGGEGNGGPIDPRVGLIRDSFVGMAQILDLMARRHQPISDLARALPSYHIVKSTIPVSRNTMHRLLDEIERASQLGEIQIAGQGPSRSSRLDGLRIDWPDRWLLVRGSNTEPIVRVVAEATSAADARALCDWTNHLARSLEPD